MKIITPDTSLLATEKSVVTVGNFDGLHRGHFRLIDTLKKRAAHHHAASVVITFEPHTRMVINPDSAQPILTTFEEKALLLQQAGIDYLMRIPFNETYAHLSAQEFIQSIFIERLNTVELVMGDNHTFGENGKGTKNFLHNETGRNHFNVLIVNLDSRNSEVISSTTIRSSIIQGRIKDAFGMLGHPYLIISQRVKGVQKGSQLGFPTLNFTQPTENKVIPPAGVYAAELEFESKKIPGALYFGECPTFENRDIHFEFHAFSYDSCFPAITKSAALWIHAFIRSDSVFSSADMLVEQIKKDIETIIHYFSQE